MLREDEIEGLLSDSDDVKIDNIDNTLLSQDRIIRGRMPTLENICNYYSFMIKSELNNLADNIDVRLFSIDMIKFGEFKRKLNRNLGIGIKFNKLRGEWYILFGFDFMDYLLSECHSIADNLLDQDLKNAFTDTVVFYKKIAKIFVSKLIKSWGTVLHLNAQQVYIEKFTRCDNFTIFDHEIVIAVKFEIEIGEWIDTITLVIPYIDIIPVRHCLYSSMNIYENNTMESLEKIYQSIKFLPFELNASIAESIQIRFMEFIDLSEGDIIFLNRHENLVKIKCGGKTIAVGDFASLDSNMVYIKINRIGV